MAHGDAVTRMPKVFSERTLEAFEAAAASIPLRPQVRAFEAAAIRPGKDPGGPAGARREQFRRYIAGVDQRDPQQLSRLGDVLGALIGEVATSKQDFLVTAAERDGFVFTDGAFRVAGTSQRSFATTTVEDLTAVEERGRRLLLLADENPSAAIEGAKTLLESVCRTVANHDGSSAAKKTLDVVDIAPLRAFVAGFGEGDRLTSRHARLAAGIAVALAGFVAETYAEPR
jgi:hypothetical protein